MARYALVIGIPEYQSPFAPLPKTINDAEAVAQLLEQYGNFQEVKRLPARWNQAKNCYEVEARGVTGTELGQDLRTLLLEQAVKSEVLIYFTGHGFTVSDYLGQSKGYLATSDCAIEVDGSQIIEQRRGIALDSLNHLIRASDLSSLVVLLDCCHGGYFLERNLVEQTLTTFSSKKDYYLITASRGFEQAYVGEQHSIFTEAVLKGLSPENAGSDGQITGDRLFDSISTALKGSGQEPIRMGWGRPITLVTYSGGNQSPASTPQPVQALGDNSFLVSNSITNYARSGPIIYSEASRQIRNLISNSSCSQQTYPSDSATHSRCQTLRKNLDYALELLEDYEQQERLTSDPKSRQIAKIEQERLRQEIKSYEKEMKELEC
jgi:hypothetical protein